MGQENFAYSFWAFLKKKLLQNVTNREISTSLKIIITECDKHYCKVLQVLQSLTVTSM